MHQACLYVFRQVVAQLADSLLALISPCLSYDCWTVLSMWP